MVGGMGKKKDTILVDWIQHEAGNGKSHEIERLNPHLSKIIIQRLYHMDALKMRGLDAKKEIHVFAKHKEVKVLDVSSNNGIPDHVIFAKLRDDIPDYDNGFAFDIAQLHILVGENKQIDIRSDEDITQLAHDLRCSTNQSLTGSCNMREEETVKMAARLTRLTFSAFVTKATLYMARFINRHRRNEQGHPYHPGEAYLFMEQGEQMQDSFTPEEVTQAMEKVGISGCKVANDLMAELERLRDARMNPDLMAGGSPQAHP